MSPRTKEQFEEIREKSRNKILLAALKFFAKRGYHSTSINQVAKEAGVSKGLVYNYYDSKEDLLKGVVEMGLSQGDQMMENTVSDDPRETLRQIFEVYFQTMQEQKDYWKLFTELSFQINEFDFIQELADNKYETYMQLFEQLLKAAGHANPKDEARILGALFDGIAVQYFALEKNLPLDEMKEYLIEKYC